MQGNRVMLIGYVGSDIKSTKLDNGNKRVHIRMATHYKRRSDQVGNNHTVWHDIIAWNNEATFAEKSFVKGSKILVEGFIDYCKFIDKNGHPRTITQIEAQSLLNLDR